MKHTILSLALVSGALALQAQNENYRHTLSAQTGLNGLQLGASLANFILEEAEAGDYKVGATPTFGLNYDYGINPWFSIGGALSYNNLSVKSDNISLDLGDQGVYEGRINAKLSRTNVSARTLFHYFNNERFDFYSGLRLGVSIWSGKVESEGTQSLVLEDILQIGGSGAAFAPQLIPFGFRGYLTEQLALGLETGIGPTHYLAVQASFRF